MASWKKLTFWKKEERRREKEFLRIITERNSELELTDIAQLKRINDQQKELEDQKKIEGILRHQISELEKAQREVRIKAQSEVEMANSRIVELEQEIREKDLERKNLEAYSNYLINQLSQNMRKEVAILQGRIKKLNTNLKDTNTEKKAEECAPTTNNYNKEEETATPTNNDNKEKESTPPTNNDKKEDSAAPTKNDNKDGKSDPLGKMKLVALVAVPVAVAAAVGVAAGHFMKYGLDLGQIW
jgi:chromosome segregation ATPase